MRSLFPLVEIVFFLSVSSAPKDATDIQITGLPPPAHWIRTSKGWYGGRAGQKATWSTTDVGFVAAQNRSIPREIEAEIDVSEPFVVIRSGIEKGAVDVSEFIERTPGNGCRLKNQANPSKQSSLDKTADGFVYTAHNSEPIGHYKITYSHRPNHAPDHVKTSRRQ